MALFDFVIKNRKEYKDFAKYINVIEYKEFNDLNLIINKFIKNNYEKLLANRCHIIAMQFAKQYPDKIQYVEGYASTRWLDTNIVIPVQHAWNKWNDMYFDLMAEIVFKISFDEYVMLAEADLTKLASDESHPFLNDDLLFGYHLFDRLKF